MTMGTNPQDTPEERQDSFEGGLLEGTQVRTPCGPRRVENVRPGDLIVTRSNGLQPVRMVWRRSLSQDRMRAEPERAPVRLKPRAVGPMMPQQDLVLAPEHPILIPGYRLDGVSDTAGGLMAAGALAGTSDAAYVDRSMERARLFSLVFDTPQIFVANGLPVASVELTETVVAGLDEDLRDSVLQLFPQLRREPSAYPPVEFDRVQPEAYRP
ncbi:hypothetical protein BV394_11990 [Brevirhabdus pacifica]|uniref:Uncharacterized protein n=1 Tax=Brevirhabdus pacifica TaxID=1267768 RepID=A0A1U7DKF0_9RHOB|nr:Hint domain-containing protein [Brevirhabdus pacifica]APX90359.1 hypothetical protein BV394_11990 [Brevirhabdus pacifica]OWU78609.1 hypothetical protein ATO5_07465 [Loktanella sp. 22II-4b]PJJ80815.1 Hint domain-containing protein [Brevirhabdus pacifica]